MPMGLRGQTSSVSCDNGQKIYLLFMLGYYVIYCHPERETEGGNRNDIPMPMAGAT